ncbi:TetR family transcriptional regulator [Kribbella sandramycini]|uniref:AcrR family transcriptional regulator n=1 Tax=Kribbella sandramycini TaxID=60450 RepID=A0A7Y4L1D1_9ACTN|nr:TetR/AcrR family transcriptional regulator [Kribbella sandramycini]MBB6564842.1 AcrR family transcriptional regulator [Kribbella sandramycini]NOL42540.1 TetR family transcriptional regulator [Kribbella sandramycini]
MIDAVGARPRPRVEGGREEEILEAAVSVLAELGYDRLTMDAVATAAKASKATLYRRWSTKADLVADAISRSKGCPLPEDVDTGSLRGDLIAQSCGVGGFTDEMPMSVIAGLITALHRDADLQKAFQERFLAPRIAISAGVYARAAARGEIAPDADVELLAMTLPAIVVHNAYVLGIAPTEDLILRVIDNVILPAARGSQAS